MTTISEIPLRPQSEAFTVSLGTVLYRMQVVWRTSQPSPPHAPQSAPSAGAWFLDIADQSGNRILSGLPLVTGCNLLRQHPEAGISGSLVVATDNNTDAVPTYANLGSLSHLYYAVSP